MVKYSQKATLYALSAVLILVFLIGCDLEPTQSTVNSRVTQSVVNYITTTPTQLEPIQPTPSFINHNSSQISPPSYPGTYDNASQIIFFYANTRTWPGGGQPDVPFCNHVPELRIWGDGRVVRKVWEGTTQSIWAGYITPDEMQEILAILKRYGFFGTPTAEVNPAGTGFDIIVNLQTGSFQSTWQPHIRPPVYQVVVDLVSPQLSEFIPEQARFFAVSYSGRFYLPDNVPQWPDDFDFRLVDVPEEGRLVQGEELEYLWRAIGQHPVLTVFQEGNNIYAVALEVPNVTNPQNLGQDSECW